jgi:hypothetical protein
MIMLMVITRMGSPPQCSVPHLQVIRTWDIHPHIAVHIFLLWVKISYGYIENCGNLRLDTMVNDTVCSLLTLNTQNPKLVGGDYCILK